jgi:hypothetical protein
MAHQLRFLAQPLPNVPSDELLRRYRHIDELGFDLAAVADHFVDWNHPPNPWHIQLPCGFVMLMTQ